MTQPVPGFLRDLRLDPSSPAPLYYQLREILRERLEQGELRPGDRFPTEAAICRASGLSRMTVRQALEELKAGGLVAGRRGAGTVVTAAAAREKVDDGEDRGGQLALRSFTEIFRGQGRRVGGRVLSKTLVNPPEGVRRELGLGPDDRAFEVRRVRYLNGEAVSLETSHYPREVARALEATDLDDRSVYEVLGAGGIVPEEAVERVELSIITPYEAKTLGAPAGIAVALCRRTTFDAAGRPIEFTKSVYRGDRHTFTSRLRRSDLERRTRKEMEHGQGDV